MTGKRSRSDRLDGGHDGEHPAVVAGVAEHWREISASSISHRESEVLTDNGVVVAGFDTGDGDLMPTVEEREVRRDRVG